MNFQDLKIVYNHFTLKKNILIISININIKHVKLKKKMTIKKYNYHLTRTLSTTVYSCYCSTNLTVIIVKRLNVIIFYFAYSIVTITIIYINH